MKNLEQCFLSIKSDKLKVLIVGGGKAGYIKCKSFLTKGAEVKVIALDICEEVLSLLHFEKLSIEKTTYNKEMLVKYHLVVIATDNEFLNSNIKMDCDELCKLYINASNVEESMCITPTVGESKSTVFAIHTKNFSPKTSLFIRDNLETYLKKYDSYIDFSVNLRNSLKNHVRKSEILNFISTEDFLYIFNKGYGEKIINLFYGGNRIENSNEKE
ncbi:NAD(P)-dependent oxidoreductase [Clostridium sp. Marseille-QA1073]